MSIIIIITGKNCTFCIYFLGSVSTLDNCVFKGRSFTIHENMFMLKTRFTETIKILVVSRNIPLVFDQNETFDMKPQSQYEPIHL